MVFALFHILEKYVKKLEKVGTTELGTNTDVLALGLFGVSRFIVT